MRSSLRAIALASFCLVGALAVAQAADMPAKAPASSALMFDCSKNSYCVGPYVGARLTGLNSNLDILGSGLGGSFGAGGMAIGGNAGFQLWNGNYFAAIEAAIDYDMTGPNGFGSRLLATEGVKLGMNLAGFFGLQQGATPAPSAGGPLSGISIPATLMSSLTSPYISTGAAQRFDETGTYFGAGLQFLIASQITADADYKHVMYDKSVMANGVTPAVLDKEDRLTIGLNYHFKP